MKNCCIFLAFVFFSCGHKFSRPTLKNLTISQTDSICNFVDDSIMQYMEWASWDRSEGMVYYTQDKDTKREQVGTLYRIRHVIRDSTIFYESFFHFYEKKLIRAKVQTLDVSNSQSYKLLYSATYYFKNDSCIETKGKNIKDAADVLKVGLHFQTKYYEHLMQD